MTRAIAYAGLACAVLAFAVAMCTDAANARANALRTALIAAWREHGIERTPGGQGDGGVVTAQGAMQRLCWN